jgi:uncharacterized protein (TIGR00106 family)
MRAIADLNIIVVGTGMSLSPYVAACIELLKERGLKVHVHALGSNIEGEIGDVLRAVEACHELVHRMGAGRIVTTVKLTTRTDREQTLEEKVQSVIGLIEPQG